jgi:hypothetical protein
LFIIPPILMTLDRYPIEFKITTISLKQFKDWLIKSIVDTTSQSIQMEVLATLKSSSMKMNLPKGMIIAM